jgi:AAA+ superfamily predicted ATPase
MKLDIDFGRTINPAFSMSSPSISPSAQKVIHNCLPLINAVNPLRYALSCGLLGVHSVDLAIKCYEGLSGEKNWEELKPLMLNSASAISHLALSIWFPYLHLIGSECFGLVSNIQNFDMNKPVFSTAQISLQSLYLMTILLKEIPSYKEALEDTLHVMSSEKEKSGIENEEWYRTLAPTIFHAQKLFEYANFLPLIFRNITDLRQYPKSIAVAAFLGRIFQAGDSIFSIPKTHFTWRQKLDTLSILLPLLIKSARDDIEQELSRVNIIDKIYTLAALALTLGNLYRLWGEEFGRSFVASKGKPVKMDDVIGCETAKESMNMVIDQIKNPTHYTELGPRKPLKGMLFYGPPGTGKSMIARAFATEINTEHFLVCTGPSFIYKYVGVGASTVRSLFNQASGLAKKHPERLILIFVDEIDAIGEKRSASPEGGEHEYNNTTNAFLTEIDQSPPNVIVIGATNKDPKELDPAFIRAGRFDKYIKFEIPPYKDRKKMLINISKAYKLSAAVNDDFWGKISSQTDQWNFADLDNLMNQAATRAGFKRLPEITPEIFEETLASLKKTDNPSHMSIYI